MNVYQRRKNQEAGGEVVMENAAGQPWSGNKQSDSASDQNGEIGQGTPVAPGFFRRLTAGIVTRNPQVLRGVHHSQNSGTVAALRNFQSFDQGDDSRQEEPKKLG